MLVELSISPCFTDLARIAYKAPFLPALEQS